MAIYGISDLHLALSIDKPMDIFGARWQNYMTKIKNEWEAAVKPEDYVIIPGDISWATYLEQAVEDFKYINSLPGIKFISKGNHDYWWTTHNKLEKFITANGFNTIRFMHNNSFSMDGIILTGTRGWKCPGDDEFTDEDDKIYKRELQRLELSLSGAVSDHCEQRIVTAMHYPPVNSKGQPSGFVDIMKKFGVKECLYGHLHGEGFKKAFEGDLDGITFKLISADYLNFKPWKLDG